MQTTADAVVIGGGILGASTACFLAKKGFGKIVLLEKRTLAAVSTGHSAAAIRTFYSNPVTVQLARRAVEMFSHAEEELGGHDHEESDMKTSFRRRWLYAVAVLPSVLLLPSSHQAQAGSRTPAQPGEVRVFYYRDNSPQELKNVPKPPPGTKVYTPTDLSLILKGSVVVKVLGLYFRVDQEGMYRFCNFRTRQTRNTILPGDDVFQFAGHLSRLQVHGWRHNGESPSQWTERAKTGRISLTCGRITQFVRYHVNAQGYRSRRVELKTLDEWNSYDNGHFLMEIFCPKEQRWILFDPDMGCRFRYEGRYLNLGETTRLYKSGSNPELAFQAYPAVDTYSEADAPAEFAQYSLFGENVFLPPERRHVWYRRVFQVPFISGSYPLSEKDGERLNSRRLVGKQLSWEQWLKQSY